MSKSQILRIFVTVSTCISMCFPTLANAGSPARTSQLRAANVLDVKLESGKLSGQIVNAQGIAIPNVDVIVARDGKVVGSAKSNGAGMFVVPGIRTGILQVATADGHVVCRAWSNRTAPPNARQSILMVNGTTVRGQNAQQAVHSAPVDPSTGKVTQANHVRQVGYNPALVHRGGIGVFANSPAIVPNGQTGIGANLFGGGLRSALSSPIAVAGVLGAAIATPIAVLDDDDAS